MTLGVLEWIAGVGGIGAVFGLIMFYVLLKIVKLMRDDRRYTEDRMTSILNDYNKTTSENTKALTELVTLLRTLNGRLK